MRRLSTYLTFVKSLLTISFVLVTVLLSAQQTKIQDYVIFGGNGSCSAIGQTIPVNPGCAVQIGDGTNITGGDVGSYGSIKTTGSVIIHGNLYSGRHIELSNDNTIAGNISVANLESENGIILQTGSNLSLNGNIDVNGNIVIGGGAINGKVTHPAGTTYSGPIPSGGNIMGTPVLPALPRMPGITNFPAAGTTSVEGTQTINPGAYNKLMLGGNKTLTFSGPGDYIFNSITDKGAVNTFVFDFKNNSTGIFNIYVYGDVDLHKSNVQIINGGDASRIYAETHGTGATSSDGASAWVIANGSGSSDVQISAWAGTIWAPFAAIDIGTQTSSSRVTGAFWSGTQVNIGGNVTINHKPFTAFPAQTIFPYYTPPNNFKVNNLIGAELLSLYQNQGSTSNLSHIFLIQNDSVFIEVIAVAGKYGEVLNLLQSDISNYGLTDLISNGQSNLIITGKYPIAHLMNLNSLASLITFCRPLYPPVTNSGVTQTLGDSAMRTNYVRNGFKVQGEGTRIGVMSDSYNNLGGASNDVVNGDLPGIGNSVNSNPVHVLKDYNYGQRSDEGRAMLQIIHDIAPKADLSFRTGFISPGDFAVGISELTANNCDVIVDDITFITEPYFKPGVVEKAIKAASALGVNYITAAGNFGSKSYEAIFNPSNAPAGLTGKAHNFGGGDILQSDSVKGSLLTPGVYTMVLQWVDDIYSIGETTTGTVNDMDIYLADDNGIPLFGFNRNNLGGDPLEVIPFTVTANTVTNILVINASPNPTPNLRFKYVVFRGDLKINEFNTGNSTIVGQGNSPDAITVGAARYTKTPAFGVTQPVLESFSSTGGTVLVNNVIPQKPDIIAPDGGNTTVNFNSVDLDGDGLPNFFGTSAAAPHVAGAVALMLQARVKFYNEVMSPADVKSTLLNNSIDMDTPGFDFKTGHGFIQADAALRTFANPTPQVIKLELADSTLAPGVQPMELIIYGNYLSTDTRIILGTDTLPSTIINFSKAVATLPVFSGNQFITAFTPYKSPSGLDGGLSNSISITGIPKKNITVVANNTTKKYAEEMPAFTATILVDGDSLQNTTLTLQDLGLNNITYQSPANELSDVGIFYIRPSRIFDTTNQNDKLFLDKYNYAFTDGALTITKLPIKITSRDTTLVYGQEAGDFGFNYTLDATANIENPGLLINTIKNNHGSQLVMDVVGLVNGQAVTIVNGQAIPIVNGQAVTIVNGQAVTIVNGQAIPIVNGQAITIVNGQAVTIVNNLTETQLNNISFLATNASLQNTREVNTIAFENGVYVPQTTYVVDITQESILDFIINSAQTSFLSSVSAVEPKGLVDISSLINGQAITIVNGQAVTIVNGQAVTIVNGQAVTIVNGQAVTIVNGQAVPIVNGQNKTAVIIDGADIGNGISNTKSLNMITGLDAGNQYIIPAAFSNDNLEVSYGLGKLTILPAPVTVIARDTFMFQDEALPAFTSEITGMMPGDAPSISFTLSPAFTGDAGAYSIVPELLDFENITNYSINYVNGTLYVNPDIRNAKKLRNYLDCVQEVLNPSSPDRRYIAHFYCVNDNSTALYIPKGEQNEITGKGIFDDSQLPALFLPDTTRFDVYFDGTDIKWELITYGTNKKSATTSDASSSSNKCSDVISNGISAINSRAYMMVGTTSTGLVNDPESKLPGSNINVYPNPSHSRATIYLRNEKINVNGSALWDVNGKRHPIKITKWISENEFEINISQLRSGFYFLRLKVENGFRTIKIIKE